MYPTRCFQTSFFLILLKLSFSSLVYHIKCLIKLNDLNIHLPNDVILLPVVFACKIGIIFYQFCHMHNISLLFLNRAITIFVNWDEFEILLIETTTACTKFTIATLFYSICLPLKLIVPNLSSTILLMLSPAYSPTFYHVAPMLESLHLLKINERMKYKVLSLTYKSLKTDQLSCLRSLLSSPSHRSTRSSFLIILSHSSLKIANISYHSAPVL